MSSVDDGQVEDVVEQLTPEVDSGRTCTDNAEGSWFSVNLGTGVSFLASAYCLRHGDEDKQASMLLNWELQGSQDGLKWHTLKLHVNDRGLFEMMNKRRSKAGWELQTDRGYSVFRILQTGLNSSKEHRLCCAGIELYGELLIGEPKPVGTPMMG